MNFSLLPMNPNDSASAEKLSSIAIVGAGPRGAAVCERLAAASMQDSFSGRVVVHVIDPWVGVGGAVWRHDQSDVLLMNTETRQTTLFPDSSTAPRLGPGIGSALRLDEFLADAGYDAHDYAPRREHGRYIHHVIREASRLADPQKVQFEFHEATVLDCLGDERSTQRLILDDSSELTVDAVVFALGHLHTEANVRLRSIEKFAHQHSLPVAMPSNPLDVDYAQFDSAKTIAIEGMGLNFFDALGALSERFSGEFVHVGEGKNARLEYRPGGDEPHLIVGSRSGQLYRAKPDLGAIPLEPYVPQILSNYRVEELARRVGGVGYETDIVPLIRAELQHALEGAGMSAEAAVGTLTARLFPLGRERVSLHDAHERTVRALRASVEDSSFPPGPEWLLTYRVLAALRSKVNELVAREALTSESFITEWLGYGQNSFAAWRSGPPILRARQLLALVEAGLVTFTGPGMHVGVLEKEGLFEVRAGDHRVGRADAFLAAHLPSVDLGRYTSSLMRNLRSRGEIRPARLAAHGHEQGPLTGSVDCSRVIYPVRESGSVDERRMFLGVPASTAQPGSAISAEPGTSPQLLILAECAVIGALDTLGHLTLAQPSD